MINVFGSSFGKEEISLIKKSFKAGWIGMGPKVREFEDAFERRIGKPFVMVNNGSSALHLAVRMLKLKPGSKVIVPSFTFVACINALLLEGLEPVLCDVEEDGNMSQESVKKSWTRGVKAIMAVHYGGKACDMRGLMSLGVPIIEDAAHAVDTMTDMGYCGAIGRIGAYSFDPIKNLPTPDAGGVAMEANLVEEARCLRDLGLGSTGFSAAKSGGKWWQNPIVGTFPKYIPNDVAACVALEQLKKLDENQKKRKNIWDFYRKSLESTELEIPECYRKRNHSFFAFMVILKRRDDLARYLLDRGVYTTLRFHPLHEYKIFKKYAGKSDYKVSNHLRDHALNLPLHTRLTRKNLKKVCREIHGFFHA